MCFSIFTNNCFNMSAMYINIYDEYGVDGGFMLLCVVDGLITGMIILFFIIFSPSNYLYFSINIKLCPTILFNID